MYGKFFSSTFTGSMYGAGAHVFAVWGYVIANTVNSKVELNSKMLSAILGTPEGDIQAAIEYLCQPDDRSRNKNSDGRRLVKEGEYQYHVVSHVLYRQLRNEEDRREYNRVKKQESRARLKKNKMSNEMSINGHRESPESTHTEADTEAEKTGLKPSVRPEEFANLWNRKRGPLPRVDSFSESRRKKVQIRMREGITLEKFSKAVECCVSKPFLRGDNSGSWVATFDWLIENDTNIDKALNNPYGLQNGSGKQDPLKGMTLLRAGDLNDAH